MTIERLRQLLHDNPPSPADGYPQEVRDAVARYAKHRREDGEIWSVLEAELGMSSASMVSHQRSTEAVRARSGDLFLGGHHGWTQGCRR